MGHSMQHGKSAKIFVERDNNPFLSVCIGENLLVTRINRPVTTPLNVMTSLCQRIV